MILSLVTSVIIWLVIVYYVEPDKVQTIRNVPVTITADQVDALAALNLRIVDSEIETVDVRIEGARPVVGAVKPADVDIRADLSGITAPGSFDVVLSGGKTGNYSAGDKFGKGFTLAQTDAISPTTVRVRVDRRRRRPSRSPPTSRDSRRPRTTSADRRRSARGRSRSRARKPTSGGSTNASFRSALTRRSPPARPAPARSSSTTPRATSSTAAC